MEYRIIAANSLFSTETTKQAARQAIKTSRVNIGGTIKAYAGDSLLDARLRPICSHCHDQMDIGGSARCVTCKTDLCSTCAGSWC